MSNTAIQEITIQWCRLPGNVIKKTIVDFTKLPSGRNEAYLVGFLTACKTFGIIDQESYSYWLAYSGQHTEALRKEVQWFWTEEKIRNDPHRPT
jgi:hypothetical protein